MAADLIICASGVSRDYRVASTLLLLTTIFTCLIGSAASTKPINPAPYAKLHSKTLWKSPSGRHLAFCLLGDKHAPRARAIAVYEKTGHHWRRLFLDRDRGFNPESIQLAELDGDPLPEIAIGVYKTTRFHPVMARRLFIYDWTDNDRLSPKWLGSRLGLTLERFAFARADDGIDRLLTVEHSGRQRLALRQYRWMGFGFSHEIDLVRISNPDDYDQDLKRLIKKMERMAKRGL